MYAFTICSSTSCVKLRVIWGGRRAGLPVGDVPDHERAARGVQARQVDLQGLLEAALRVREREGRETCSDFLPRPRRTLRPEGGTEGGTEDEGSVDEG